jgi:hypothetical protein
MQLSLFYKTNDHFWSSVAHEAAHLLLHGKRGDYQTHFFPFTVVLNQAGVIVLKRPGGADWDSPEPRAMIEDLVRGAAAKRVK